MDFLSRIVDSVVDITGPYVAVLILAIVIIALIYRLMGGSK